jgi:hypothetical protein
MGPEIVNDKSWMVNGKSHRHLKTLLMKFDDERQAHISEAYYAN